MAIIILTVLKYNAFAFAEKSCASHFPAGLSARSCLLFVRANLPAPCAYVLIYFSTILNSNLKGRSSENLTEGGDFFCFGGDRGAEILENDEEFVNDSDVWPTTPARKPATVINIVAIFQR